MSEDKEGAETSLCAQYALIALAALIIFGLWFAFNYALSAQILPETFTEFLNEIFQPVPIDGTG